jgi:hypothetical protein
MWRVWLNQIVETKSGYCILSDDDDDAFRDHLLTDLATYD